MRRTPAIALSLIVMLVGIDTVRGQAPAAGAVAQTQPLPATAFTASFAQVSNADAEAGTLEYLVTKPVNETRTREEIRTVTLPDGKLATTTVSTAYTVVRYVTETRQMKIAGVMLTNTAGKSMPLADAMKKVNLKGRDVLIAKDATGIDPYYLKFLAKDVLILVPAAMAVAEPTVEAVPVPVPAPTP